jgi:hypothetical protein
MRYFMIYSDIKYDIGLWNRYWNYKPITYIDMPIADCFMGIFYNLF